MTERFAYGLFREGVAWRAGRYGVSIEQEDTGGMMERNVPVVRDHHDGHVALRSAGIEHVVDICRAGVVYARLWLVKNNKGGITDESARQVDPLQFSAGEIRQL